MKKYTIEEIKNYLDSQDSLGDIHYYLSEEYIDKAQQLPVKIINGNNGEILLELDQSYIDDEDGILDKIKEYYNFIDEEIINESNILMDLVEFLDENDLILTIED